MSGVKMSGVNVGGKVSYIRNYVLCLYYILYHSFYLKIENYH